MRGENTLGKKNKTQEIKKKLEYLGLNLKEIPKEFQKYKPLEFIGLDLENIPKTLKLVEDLKFRPNSGFDEKKYRQYRFVSPKEIQILLSPTNRLDDIKEKYSKASPLADYLDSETEENIINHTTFLNMLKQLRIEDVEKIEEEQETYSYIFCTYNNYIYDMGYFSTC